MHISHPIRFPEDRAESQAEAPRARNGAVFAAVVFAVFAVIASLVLVTHGVSLPCGEDPTVTCANNG